MSRAYIWKELKRLPSVDKSVVIRTAASAAKEPLREVIVPKPEVLQVEPIAIPDEIHFEPLRVRKSIAESGFFLEIDGAKHYGATPLEALGQAVLDGAFGALTIELP